MHKNSYNKVILVGHLGGNPEGRYTKSGRATISFSLATNESWKDASGNITEHTEWHKIVAWDKLADFGNEYLYKGQLIFIEGVLRTRSWVSKAGESHKTTEVVCDNITPMEWKQKTENVR